MQNECFVQENAFLKDRLQMLSICSRRKLLVAVVITIDICWEIISINQNEFIIWDLLITDSYQFFIMPICTKMRYFNIIFIRIMSRFLDTDNWHRLIYIVLLSHEVLSCNLNWNNPLFHWHGKSTVCCIHHKKWWRHRYFNTLKLVTPYILLKAADDDAGKLQPVFLKRLYLLHICIFSFFSFQRKFNNHLKILTTTIWSTISRFYHCYFIVRWNVLFSRFYFQLVNG